MSEICYDAELEKRHSGVCPMNYDPVRGCDGKMYSNGCVAESKGISKYEKLNASGMPKRVMGGGLKRFNYGILFLVVPVILVVGGLVAMEMEARAK